MPMAEPASVGPALLKIVDAEKPPLRVFFGPLASQVVPYVYAERLKAWHEWAHVGTEGEAVHS
jgi:hypothetical protein